MVCGSVLAAVYLRGPGGYHFLVPSLPDTLALLVFWLYWRAYFHLLRSLIGVTVNLPFYSVANQGLCLATWPGSHPWRLPFIFYEGGQMTRQFGTATT